MKSLYSKFRIVIVFALLGLLTFLFFKTRFLDVAEHDRYTETLRIAKEQDSELNQDFLKITYSVLRSYDSVVDKFSRLAELAEQLEEVPAFLTAESGEDLKSLLEQYTRLLSEKGLLFQRFRRANVRLRNSLSYLPVLATEVTQRARQSRNGVSAELVQELLRDVLLYVLASDAERIPSVEGHLTELNQFLQDRPALAADPQLSLLEAHVRTVMEFRPEVDQIAAQLLSMPTQGSLETVRSHYDAYYRDAIAYANRYRAVLYALSLVLFLWGAFTFIRLRQASAELAASKEGLEENVARRTRELAGSQARNRALLDAIPDLMLRISASGEILDVKASAEVVLPAPVEELLGAKVESYFPHTINEGKVSLQRAIETREPQLFLFDSAEDGETQHFEARVVASGQDEALVIVRNVSEQKRSADRVVRAQERSEKLLRNILPAEVAEELKLRGSVEPRYYGDVSILATHFIGFSAATEELAAEELVLLLHDYFAAFDEIVSRYGLEKLKTLGDRYMCVGGLSRGSPSHPVDAVLAGLELIRVVREREKPIRQADWAIAIGVHTGPVVAGVVGKDKFAFDVFGHSVRFCSQIEAAAAGNQLNVSADTYRRVKDFVICKPGGTSTGRTEQEPGEEVDPEEVEVYSIDRIQPSLLSSEGVLPPAEFQQRYSIYFHSDPPSFPRQVDGEGRLILSSGSERKLSSPTSPSARSH